MTRMCALHTTYFIEQRTNPGHSMTLVIWLCKTFCNEECTYAGHPEGGTRCTRDITQSRSTAQHRTRGRTQRQRHTHARHDSHSGGTPSPGPPHTYRRMRTLPATPSSLNNAATAHHRPR